MENEGEMPDEHIDMPEMDDQSMDDELNEAAAGELLSAIEAKDKKQILESIRAIVMNCGGGM